MAIDPLKPIPASKWDDECAKHLLNRAGFGVPRARVKYLAQVGARKAVDAIVDFDRVPQYGTHPKFLVPIEETRVPRTIKDIDERRQAQQNVRRAERQAVNTLQQWWLERMLNSPRPLEEKMTLFWHGHFATSAQKVRSSWANYDLHQLFRKHATGDFKQLTTEVGQTPCMLRYLDNNQNVKEHPNENWARELMELFTMGIGNYTEDDIKQSARAFTGWTFGRNGYYFDKKKHDTGTKTFLSRTGNFDGHDIIDIIFEQDATADFIAKKLYMYFVNETPDVAVTDAMATTFRQHKYKVEPMLRELFLSEHFYEPANRGNQIKSPAQFVVQLAHDLNMDHPPYASMAQASAQLGQNLFFPPNVKGWDGGRAWINANTLLTRYNLPVSLAQANGHKENMAMQENMAGPTMPAMMAPEMMKEEARNEMRAFMLSLPPEERQNMQQHMSKMKSQKEKSRYVQRQMERKKNYDRWSATEVFEELSFTTAADCVNALEKHFLTVPLSTDQRQVLAKALADGNPVDRVRAANIMPDAKNATLHLLLSTAEYQLT